jgi:uncharacterized membrane protein
MSSTLETTIGRAVILGAVTGLRAAMGPALVSASRRRSGREMLAAAALAELLVDKLPITPSRSSLPALIPRALAGYWVGSQVAEQDRSRDATIPIAAAAAATGAALLAPTLRSMLGSAFRVPDVAVGVLEDALAISLGSLAAGLSRQDLSAIVADALRLIHEQAPAAPESVRELLPRS